jgi:hypothetical protein
MAHTAETVDIGGTKVKVAVGTRGGGSAGVSRTVNVYDHTNSEGCYQEVYRLPDGSGISAAEICRHARTLDELDRYLMGKGAVKEGPRAC